jgi:hypothetical protein
MKHSVFVGALAVMAGAVASVQGQVTLSASMTVDNTFTASISTNPLTAGTSFLTGNNWQQTYSDSTLLSAPGTYYLQVRATDLGRPEMFVGQFGLAATNGFSATFSNSTTSLLTNSTDWVVSNTGFGVSTVAPLDIGANVTGSTWGVRPGISSAARFLWAPNYTGTVYFTAVITVVPAPGCAGALALAGLVATRRRR